MKKKSIKQFIGIQSYSGFFVMMSVRQTYVSFAVFLFLLFGFTSCGQDRQEVKLSSGKYVIVIPEAATDTEQKAAKEFKRLLDLAKPVQIDIVKDSQPVRDYEIVIGATNRPLPERTTDLQRDGFTIQTDDRKLYIQGGSKKGTLYGVYSFFETYLGYRCYAPDVFVYPSLAQVAVSKGLRDTQIPVNTFRNDFFMVTFNCQFYADWHKVHYNDPKYKSVRLNGPEWGLFGHTCAYLVPPSQYFKDHPEYYALIGGKRDTGQLCLSNPAVLGIVIDSLTARMKRSPEALYWSVGQNDNKKNCKCENCRAIDDANGSRPAGSVITFANKVAERFPDKIIATFAYSHSIEPPTQVKPLPNVIIMLAPYWALRHITIEEDPQQKAYIEGWGKITDNILLWDYVANFDYYMAPFPQLFIMQPNVKFFNKNGIVAQYQQGNYQSENGEFENLRAYLLAKILWNPDVDVEAEMADFLTGYYENAAPFIEQYIRITHDELKQSGMELSISQHPYCQYKKGFLRAELLEKYEQLFDQAEAAVETNPAVLLRVQTARLPLTYATFEIAKKIGKTDSRIFDSSGEPKPAAVEKLKLFFDVCKKANVKYMNERADTIEAYYANTKKFLYMK